MILYVRENATDLDSQILFPSNIDLTVQSGFEYKDQLLRMDRIIKCMNKRKEPKRKQNKKKHTGQTINIDKYELQMHLMYQIILL